MGYYTDASCEDEFQINSTCYKIHKEEKVRWFTAVNRCLSNNGTLAVFDDDVRQYFPSILLSDNAWIGLIKSWWTWPGQLAFNCSDISLLFQIILHRRRFEHVRLKKPVCQIMSDSSAIFFGL